MKLLTGIEVLGKVTIVFMMTYTVSFDTWRKFAHSMCIALFAILPQQGLGEVSKPAD